MHADKKTDRRTILLLLLLFLYIILLIALSSVTCSVMVYENVISSEGENLYKVKCTLSRIERNSGNIYSLKICTVPRFQT